MSTPQADIIISMRKQLAESQAREAGLREELKEAIFERDLAIAHDRQPYPTAEAYELACETRDEARANAHIFRYEREDARAYARKLRGVLEDIQETCLCERFKTLGFDYSEKHEKKGKPKIGRRWRTPSDFCTDALSDAPAWIEGKK